MNNRIKKGCGIGCFSVLILGALVFGGTWCGLERHYTRAWDKGQQLDHRHGPRADFHPGAGPVFAAADLERFLTVRRALAPQCIQATASTSRMMSLHQDDGRDEGDRRPSIKQALFSISGVLGATKGLGDFALARNQALLAADMGCGQYTWLYVMTYYVGLQQEPILGANKTTSGNIATQAREAILGMMVSRVFSLEAHAAAMPDTLGPDHAAVMAEAEIWRSEREAMIADETRLPFSDGPPSFISEAIAPYREVLLEYFCPATDALEMLRIKEHGIGYEDQ